MLTWRRDRQSDIVQSSVCQDQGSFIRGNGVDKPQAWGRLIQFSSAVFSSFGWKCGSLQAPRGCLPQHQQRIGCQIIFSSVACALAAVSAWTAYVHDVGAVIS